MDKQKELSLLARLDTVIAKGGEHESELAKVVKALLAESHAEELAAPAPAPVTAQAS